MRLPASIPGLKVATILWGLYGAVWISLEGDLQRVGLLGVWTTAVSLGHLLQKYGGERPLSLRKWLAVTAVSGLLLGLGSGLLTLAFMALKTGLHAHGPEFTAAEITWVVGQLPLWSVAGVSGGAGLGLLIAARSQP